MKVSNVAGYNFNKKYVNPVSTVGVNTQVNLYQQKQNIYFCASALKPAELRKLVKQIPTQGDTRALFGDVIDFAADNVKNMHQVEFLKKILGVNLDKNHPIIEKMQLNQVSEFSDTIESIKTKENLDAMSYMFDFLLKRPEFLYRDNGYHKSQIIEFSKKKYHKEFINYVDENYDYLIENDEFPQDFRFLIGNLSAKKVDLYKDFIDFAKSHYEGKSFKTLPLGQYLHAIDNEHNHNYVKTMLPITNKDNRYYFLDWYLINGIKSKEASKTVQEVFKTVEKTNKSLEMPPDKFIYAVNSDKNLGVKGLLEIDRKYGISMCNPYSAPKGYDGHFWEKYVAIHDKAKTNNFNQYSRALLNYIMENVHRYDYEKYGDFLSKTVLESINAPARLRDAKAIVDGYIKEPELAKPTPYGRFDLMFCRYKMSPDEILALKRKYYSGPFDYHLYKEGINKFRELATKYQENHNQ